MTASTSGAILSFVSKNGSAPVLSATSQSNPNAGVNGPPSFLAIPASTFTGTGSLNILGTDWNELIEGSDGSGGITWTGWDDSGYVTVSVNGFSLSTPYSQGTSASQLASSLASNFNSQPGSPVTASSSSGALTLTSKSGPSSQFTVLAYSQSTEGTVAGPPSFPVIPQATFTGAGTVNIVGTDWTQVLNNGNNWYEQQDSGTVSVTINGTTKTVNYSTSSTCSSLASALAAAFNSAQGTPVTASASGGTLSFSSKAGANGQLTVSSTAQSNAGGSPGITGPPSFVPIPWP